MRWPEPMRRFAKPVAGWLLTGLATLLILFALVAPDTLGSLSLIALVRIPIEGLLALAVLLTLPPKAQRVTAIIFGALLGVIAILKIVDMGFYAVLNRPFDLVLDWSLFGAGADALTASLGRVGGVGAIIAVIALVIGIVAGMALSARRLLRLAADHRTGTTRTAGALAIVWAALALLGAHIVPGLPVASDSTADLITDRARQVARGVDDAETFKRQVGVDAFRDVPDDQLLTRLRGKDVLVTFIESYGRVALEDPLIAPGVDAVLADGEQRLKAAGFEARSGFLTSPTFGGGSWLAHATFDSGLWVDNQKRHQALVKTNRLTLTSAFERANWQTVAVYPGTRTPWQDADFFGFDRVYYAQNMGYKGPPFGWSTMPDQYALADFQHFEYGQPNHPPLMAQIVLTSSHWPWVPVPRFYGNWADVGNGTGYADHDSDAQRAVLAAAPAMKSAYATTIEYSLDTLISYVTTYADPNLVLVFLGDHQPIPTVSGENASYDVPITIVAHDPAVLDDVSSWGWTPGLKPSPQAPVWPMDAFRDKFFTAFGSTTGSAGP